VGKLEGKRPFGKRSRRWEDNITMDFQGVRWVGMHSIDMAQDRSK